MRMAVVISCRVWWEEANSSFPIINGMRRPVIERVKVLINACEVYNCCTQWLCDTVILYAFYVQSGIIVLVFWLIVILSYFFWYLYMHHTTYLCYRYTTSIIYLLPSVLYCINHVHFKAKKIIIIYVYMSAY